MNRITKFVAVVVLSISTASFASAQPASSPKEAKNVKTVLSKVRDAKIPLKTLISLGKKLSGAADAKMIFDLADDASRTESAMLAKTIERGFKEKGQLVSGTTSVDVVVDVTASYWRGSVRQQLTMPCTATLAFELDSLLANASYNPATKTIEVYLPQLSIIAVESHNSKYTTEPEYFGGCWEWYDSGKATELEVKLLKSDWGALARERIDPNAQHLRAVASNEASRFLRQLLGPINPSIKIVVNP